MNGRPGLYPWPPSRPPDPISVGDRAASDPLDDERMAAPLDLPCPGSLHPEDRKPWGGTSRVDGFTAWPGNGGPAALLNIEFRNWEPVQVVPNGYSAWR